MFSLNPVDLAPFDTKTVTLRFATTELTPKVDWTFTITGMSGGSSRSTSVDVTVHRLKVVTFFTLAPHAIPPPFPAPLPLDSKGNPKVDVVIAGSNVTSTNPGEVEEWTNITDTGIFPVYSLSVTQAVPVDWAVSPPPTQSNGAVHVYWAFANGTVIDITPKTGLTFTSGNPQTITISFPNLLSTLAKKGLLPGDGDAMILAVKLSYALKGFTRHGNDYPIIYTPNTTATGFDGLFLGGNAASNTATPSFTAFAKLVGDVNGDVKVNILDAALAALAYGTKQGDKLFNPSADLNSDKVIDILDMAIIAYYYGSY